MAPQLCFVRLSSVIATRKQLCTMRCSCAKITAVALLIYVYCCSTVYAASVCDTNLADVPVLPGNFTRPVQSSFTESDVSDGQALQSLRACQFISFDPSFDAILGPQPSVSQLSSSKN